MLSASGRARCTSLSLASAILIAVGSGPVAYATPMEPTPESGESVRFLGRPGVVTDPGSVSVVAEELEVPQSFDGLLEVRSSSHDAAPSASGADALPDVAAAPPDGRPEPEPGPVAQALFRHHLRLAQLMIQEGDFEGAAENAERALEIDPDAAEARMELGFALLQLARFGEAESQLARARELGADSATLYASLARAAAALDRPRDAVRHGREALRRDPDLVPAANNLAWLLATSADPAVRDPAESIRIAQQALRAAGGSHPNVLDTLAAGYAAAGRFEEAVQTAERAAALARERGAQDLERQIHQHLERYRAGEAYGS